MKIKGKYEIVRLDDESVAIPLESDTFYTDRAITLNPTAEEIFRAFLEEATEEEVAAKLAAKYTDTPAEEIAQYLHKFIGQLTEAGILA